MLVVRDLIHCHIQELNQVHYQMIEQNKRCPPSNRHRFCGSNLYRTKTKKKSKAYILIFSCSVSRVIHLEVISNTTTKEFIKCLKRLVARRGKPTTIYSDNTKSFQAVAKWLEQIIKSEQLHENLTKENTNCKSNFPKH